MNWQRILQQVIAVALVTLFLVGCQSTIPSSPSEAPAAIPTLEPPTPTPISVPSTLAPKPKPGAPGLGDSLYPGFGNGGYDVHHYGLDLTVDDVGTGELTGVTSIEANATQDFSSFNLVFVGFTVEDIAVNKQPAEFRRSGQ